MHADTVELLGDLVGPGIDRAWVEDDVADVLDPPVAWFMDERRELAYDARDRPLVGRILPLLDAQVVRERIFQDLRRGVLLANLDDAVMVIHRDLGKLFKGKDHALRPCAGHDVRPDAEPLFSVENIGHSGPELKKPVSLGNERINLHIDNQIVNLNHVRVSKLVSRLWTTSGTSV